MADIALFYKSAYNLNEKAFTLKSDVVIRQISIGDMLIQFRLAGTSLIPVNIPALHHLIVAAQNASLNDHKDIIYLH